MEVLDHGTCTVTQPFPCFDFPTVVDNLPPAATWKFYGSTLPPVLGEVWSMLDAIKHIRMTDAWTNNVVDASQFDTDVDNGTLPSIVFLVDQDLASEHPPFNICSGENWTVDHLNHVMKSPIWNKTAILMTWDDFGGWYDHVAPPVQYGCDATTPYGLGFRLPAHRHLAVCQGGQHLFALGAARVDPEVHREGLQSAVAVVAGSGGAGRAGHRRSDLGLRLDAGAAAAAGVAVAQLLRSALRARREITRSSSRPTATNTGLTPVTRAHSRPRPSQASTATGTARWMVTTGLGIALADLARLDAG